MSLGVGDWANWRGIGEQVYLPEKDSMGKDKAKDGQELPREWELEFFFGSPGTLMEGGRSRRSNYTRLYDWVGIRIMATKNIVWHTLIVKCLIGITVSYCRQRRMGSGISRASVDR